MSEALIPPTRRFRYGTTPGVIAAITICAGAVAIAALAASIFSGYLWALFVAVFAALVAVASSLALSRYEKESAVLLGPDKLTVVSSFRDDVVPYAEIEGLKIDKGGDEGPLVRIRHTGGRIALVQNSFENRNAFETFIDALNAEIERLPAPRKT